MDVNHERATELAAELGDAAIAAEADVSDGLSVRSAFGHLVSRASAVITGVTIPCDGGVMAGGGWAPYDGFPS